MIREGVYGAKFSGGSELYSCTFQTGDEGSDTYIALLPDGTLSAFYGGKQNIGMWAGQDWGNMIYYEAGIAAGQLYASSEYDPVLGGTKRRFVVWSRDTGSLRLMGPGIELQSDKVNLAGSSSAQITVRGKIWDNLLPVIDDAGYVGMNGQRWNTVRARYITPGDLCFEETGCPICGQPFTEGDIIVLLAHHIHEEHHTMTIPIHDRCKGIQKTINIEVPETEDRFRFIDGQVEKYRVSKFIETEVQAHRVKDGYKLDEKTGEFKKKAMVVKVAKDGYSARLTPKTVKILDQSGQTIKELSSPQVLKFYDDQAGHEVELTSILESVEIFPERSAGADEVVELIPVVKRQPVMKTITVEIGEAGL